MLAGRPWQLRVEALKACTAFVTPCAPPEKPRGDPNGAAEPMQLDAQEAAPSGEPLLAEALAGIQQLLPGESASRTVPAPDPALLQQTSPVVCYGSESCMTLT